MANQQISLDYSLGLKHLFFSCLSVVAVEPFWSHTAHPHAPRPQGPPGSVAGPSQRHRAQRPAPNLPAWTEGLCEAAGLVHPKNAFTGTPVV